MQRVIQLQGKSVLIAGGTGLVGSNLTKRLKSVKSKVFSTFFSKQPHSYKGIYKKFDFMKFKDCLEATKNIDVVIICAAQTYGAKMMKENPTISILPNLKIYAGLLEACRLNKVEKVLLISSSTVYQEANHPISETELDLNKPPYDLYFGIGWMNRYIEQLAMFYYMAHGMKIGIVRPTNIYGPHDKLDVDKSNVLPALIMRALKKENPFIVWGDGSAVRDFLYVEDFIDDILGVLENYCICDPVNSGSGCGITIKEAVNVILKVCNHNVIPEFDETKPTSIPYRVLDMTKCKKILGERQRTSFEEGARRTVRWYEENL